MVCRGSTVDIAVAVCLMCCVLLVLVICVGDCVTVCRGSAVGVAVTVCLMCCVLFVLVICVGDVLQ